MLNEVSPIDERLISYLYCFNITHDYFLCHEYGESLWLDTGRPTVLKGLIQAAVCLYHLHNGNVRGGWRMWQRAKTLLTPCLHAYESIDLTALITDIDVVFASVPTDWYPKTLPPSAITSLNLPIVQVHILDEQLARALPTWTPTPLEDD